MSETFRGGEDENKLLMQDNPELERAQARLSFVLSFQFFVVF